LWSRSYCTSGGATPDKCAKPMEVTVKVRLLLTSAYAKRNNTVIEPQTVKKHEEKLDHYCNEHSDTTVMDAVKNVLGFDK